MVKGFLGIKLLFCFCLYATATVVAQAPQSINYQAVARNTETGEELINQSLYIAAKLLSNGPQGEIIYQENHSEVSTNAFGLFTLQIGEGDAVVGQFSQIDWSQGNIWLEIDLDIGNGLETIGSMQFVSVPYALYAENVANVDDADSDPENELISEINFSESGNSLVVSEAGFSHAVDLTYLKDDADANPQNEVISNMSFEPSTGVLSINEAGNLNEVTLDIPIDDADADPENELIDPDEGAMLSGTILKIIEGGILHEVELDSLVNDADPDPANELIDPVNGLVLDSDMTLQITEGGVQNEVDLSPLLDDGDWVRPDDDSDVIYNSSDKVGIGTSNPNSSFHVAGSVSYTATVFEPGLVNEAYAVDSQDYAIICKCTALGGLSVEMPDPTDTPGRIIKIIRTGNYPAFGVLFINLNGFPVDYSPGNFTLSGSFGTRVMVFMSIGADGWIILDQQ